MTRVSRDDASRGVPRVARRDRSCATPIDRSFVREIDEIDRSIANPIDRSRPSRSLTGPRSADPVYAFFRAVERAFDLGAIATTRARATHRDGR